jgi:hypothetical protein
MRFFLVLVLISFSLYCGAQNWALSSSVWRYNFVNLSGAGYIQINVGIDTIVDGVNCKKLNKRLYQRNAFTGTTQNFSIGEEYTYEDNGIVYLRHQGGFDTLYNFNALPGESWNVPGTSPVPSVCNATTKVQVIDTSGLIVNGTMLKQLIVEYQYKSAGSFKLRDTIVERMGTLGQYLVPWDLCVSTVDANEGGALRCYSDNEIGEYKHNFFSNCTQVVSVDEKSLSAFSVYPNPMKDVLYLRYTNSYEVNMVCVKDMFGRTIVQYTYAAEIIDVSALSKGVYFVEIYNDNFPLGRQKMIKF